MGIKLNLQANGQSSVFFDWQLSALEAIELTGQDPIGSREVLTHIVSNDIKISRASVINFLKYLHESDLIHGVNTSGKGGMRFKYVYHRDRTHFNEMIVQLLLKELISEFDDVSIREQLLLVGGLD